MPFKCNLRRYTTDGSAGGDKGIRDKDQIHVLESAIVTWTRQIKGVLKTDPEVGVGALFRERERERSTSSSHVILQLKKSHPVDDSRHGVHVTNLTPPGSDAATLICGGAEGGA